MDEARASGAEIQGGERRRQRRVSVAGIAVVEGGGQPPSVWRIANLSVGGASLVGGTLPSGPLSVSFHVAGFPAVEVAAKILRRQLVTRAGRSAVKFMDVPETHRQALREILGADHAPLLVSRRALIVHREIAQIAALSAELKALGFKVRQETSPEQAAAWLQRETATEILLVGESIVECDRWGLLQFVRDTAPEVRRFVLASDVRRFRLYYAMKAGLVDGLVEPKLAGDLLARRLLGESTAAPRARAPRERARGRTPRTRTRSR